MSIVDPKELEKQRKKREDEESSVTSKMIGTKRIFLGADHWYDTPGEALESRQKEKQLAEYKRLGLNEFGQTKEQEAASRRRMELIKQKERLLKNLSSLESKIAGVEKEKKKEKTETKKKKKKK